METIAQENESAIGIEEFMNRIDIRQHGFSVRLEKSTLPSFHKALGEFLPQVEVSEEYGQAKYVDENPSQYDSRDVSQARAYLRGFNDALLSQSKQEKWISVGIKPEKRDDKNSLSVDVLAANANDKMKVISYDFAVDEWATAFFVPVKWQPLPPAPTKGGKEC